MFSLLLPSEDPLLYMHVVKSARWCHFYCGGVKINDVIIRSWCSIGMVQVLLMSNMRLPWSSHILSQGPFTHLWGRWLMLAPSIILPEVISLSPQTSVVWMVGPPARSGGLTFLWSVVTSQHMGQVQLCLSHREWKELCSPSGQDTYSHERDGQWVTTLLHCCFCLL